MLPPRVTTRAAICRVVMPLLQSVGSTDQWTSRLPWGTSHHNSGGLQRFSAASDVLCRCVSAGIGTHPAPNKVAFGGNIPRVPPSRAEAGRHRARQGLSRPAHGAGRGRPRLQMAGDRVLAHDERRRDLSVALSHGDEAEHLELVRGQAVELARLVRAEERRNAGGVRGRPSRSNPAAAASNSSRAVSSSRSARQHL